MRVRWIAPRRCVNMRAWFWYRTRMWSSASRRDEVVGIRVCGVQVDWGWK